MCSFLDSTVNLTSSRFCRCFTAARNSCAIKATGDSLARTAVDVLEIQVESTGYSSRKPVSSITFFLSPETGDRPASRHSEHHHACRKDYHGSFTTRHISSCLVPSTSQSAWRNDYLCERQFLLYATSCYLFSHTLFLRKDLAALSSPLTFRRCSVFRHPFP